MTAPSPICQSALPFYPWTEPGGLRLPGLRPIQAETWLLRDDAFDAQMAYRDGLISTRRKSVFSAEAGATEAASECLDLVVKNVPVGSADRIQDKCIVRQDGAKVHLNDDHPLLIAGRLAQEDFCILERRRGRYVLTAAVLCFPASWTLSEKMGRSLAGLHAPVEAFDAQLDKRIERIFEALLPDTVLMRGNALIYTDPDLHQPRPEGTVRSVDPSAPRWVRVERQTLRRLPQSEAVVFGIHTSLVPAETLPGDAFNALAVLKPELRVGVSA